MKIDLKLEDFIGLSLSRGQEERNQPDYCCSLHEQIWITYMYTFVSICRMHRHSPGVELRKYKREYYEIFYGQTTCCHL